MPADYGCPWNGPCGTDAPNYCETCGFRDCQCDDEPIVDAEDNRISDWLEASL